MRGGRFRRAGPVPNPRARLVVAGILLAVAVALLAPSALAGQASNTTAPPRTVEDVESALQEHLSSLEDPDPGCVDQAGANATCVGVQARNAVEQVTDRALRPEPDPGEDPPEEPPELPPDPAPPPPPEDPLPDPPRDDPEVPDVLDRLRTGPQAPEDPPAPSREARTQSLPPAAFETAEGPQGPIPLLDRIAQHPAAPAAAGLTLLVPALFLFRRIASQRILESEKRRAVLALIRDRPGITAGGISRDLDLHYETVRHHLDLLHECGEVDPRRFHGRVRYYLNHGAFGVRAKQVGAALQIETQRRILEALRQQPRIASGRLARRVGVSAATTSHHLRRMGELQLVASERHGREVLYFLVDDVAQALVCVQQAAQAPAPWPVPV